MALADFDVVRDVDGTRFPSVGIRRRDCGKFAAKVMPGCDGSVLDLTDGRRNAAEFGAWVGFVEIHQRHEVFVRC